MKNLNRLLTLALFLLGCVVLSSCSTPAKSKPASSDTSAQTASAQTSEVAESPVIAPVREESAPVPAEPAKSSGLDSKYRALSHALRDSSGKASLIQEEASRLLGANPSDAIALNALAILHFHHGRTGAAKLLLARALEKNPPEAAGLHNNLGLALLAEGEQDAAIGEFKKAIALDANHAEAAANLGSIYLNAGDYQRASAALSLAYGKLRTNVGVLNNYALCLIEKSDFEGAKKTFEEALAINSREPTVLVNYAGLLIERMNRSKDGLDYVYKVKFIETERKDVLSRANALEKKAKSEVK
jgi:Flp pilus assembly protein TadD